MFDAVIFDFDGLILDTETPLFHAWNETYASHGIEPITLDRWATAIGRHDADDERFDPLRHLLTLVPDADLDAIEERRRAHRDRLLATLELRAGVMTWLDEASRRDVPVAIATSSPLDWIERHLVPRQLLERFAHVVCAGGALAGKPDPAVYVEACRLLEVAPQRAIALEDSPNGVAAAKAAGMTCIAVPCELTSGLDFGAADLRVESLADLDPEEVLGADRHPFG